MKKLNKICINCPAGCHLDITVDDDHQISVSGNTCPRGLTYAKQELTDPRRIVTAVVFADHDKRICIPVKSNVPVPMDMIPELLKTLFSTRVKLPVSVGDVILRDFNGSKIDIVCASNYCEQ